MTTQLLEQYKDLLDFFPNTFQLSNGQIGEEWYDLTCQSDEWCACFDAGCDNETFATGKTPEEAIIKSAQLARAYMERLLAES